MSLEPGDAPLDQQVISLEHILRANAVVTAILDRVPQLKLPSWYVGAGAIAQTVWNSLHSYDPSYGIRDYDIVYFDGNDVTQETEHELQDNVTTMLRDLNVKLDVTNEARVHLWYHERFGRAIAPYSSAEAAIGTWPTTATSVGVRRDDGFVVCAPFGLSDLFHMVVRPNKVIVPRAVYETKSSRWLELWPMLTILPWE